MSEKDRAAQINEDIKSADKKRADAAEEAASAGEKLDKLLAHLDSLGARLDAFELAGKPRKDEEGEGEIEKKGKPKELAADSMVVADAEEVEHFKAEDGNVRKIEANSVLADIQSHADRAASAWGKSAPHPWDGERITAYRRRLAREHQQHSSTWENVDLSTLSGQALRNATAQIFADSIAASSAPESYGETLREVVRHDPVSGQRRIEFYGSPSAWTNQFKSGQVFVRAFRTGGWRQD